MSEFTLDGLIAETRKLEWQSAHGVVTHIEDMDDTYLANLYDFLKNGYQDLQTSALMITIRHLQKERGLTDEFMNRAQIPYKNPKGIWEIWDFENGRPMELEEVNENE